MSFRLQVKGNKLTWFVNKTNKNIQIEQTCAKFFLDAIL